MTHRLFLLLASLWCCGAPASLTPTHGAIGAIAAETLAEGAYALLEGSDPEHNRRIGDALRSVAPSLVGIMAHIAGKNPNTFVASGENAVDNNFWQCLLAALGLLTNTAEIVEAYYEDGAVGAAKKTAEIAVVSAVGGGALKAAAKTCKYVYQTGRTLWRAEKQCTVIAKAATKAATKATSGVITKPKLTVIAAKPRPNAISANAQDALRRKMITLESAQKTAVKTKTLPDGRIRYYKPEKSALTPGATKGGAHVTEHNPRTGNVKAWGECYDQHGNVNRVHPKMLNGQKVHSRHFPMTKKEIEALPKNFRRNQ